MSTNKSTALHARVQTILGVYAPLAANVQAFPASEVAKAANDDAHRARVTGKYKPVVGEDRVATGVRSRLSKLEDRWDIDSSYLPDEVRAFLSCDAFTLDRDERAELARTDNGLFLQYEQARSAIREYRATLRKTATDANGVKTASALFAEFQNDARDFFAALDAEAPK